MNNNKDINPKWGKGEKKIHFLWERLNEAGLSENHGGSVFIRIHRTMLMISCMASQFLLLKHLPQHRAASAGLTVGMVLAWCLSAAWFPPNKTPPHQEFNLADCRHCRHAAVCLLPVLQYWRWVSVSSQPAPGRVLAAPTFPTRG